MPKVSKALAARRANTAYARQKKEIEKMEEQLGSETFGEGMEHEVEEELHASVPNETLYQWLEEIESGDNDVLQPDLNHAGNHLRTRYSGNVKARQPIDVAKQVS